MRNTAVAALLLAAAPFAFAAGFKKSYFAATKPGAWTKYVIHAIGPDGSKFEYAYTYTRLADEDGKPRFEIRSEFKDGQTPTSVNRYTLKKGFDIDHEMMDYGPSIVAAEMVVGDGEPQAMDEATLATVSKTIAQFGKNSKLNGTETIDGKKSDHFTYVVRYPGDPVQIETGEIWLSDAVPFGVVKQNATTKDDKGTVISSYEQTLVDSGAGK